MGKLTIQQLAANFQALANNIDQITDDIILGNEELAKRLVQNQLTDGEMPDNSPISPEYRSESYAKFKNRLNPRPTFGIPDLNLTGANYAGIRLERKGKNYTMKNINSKSKLLIKKYGDYIGMQESSEQTFRNANDKELIEKHIKKAFGQ